MDINVAQVVQGGMILVLGGIARVVYSTSVLVAAQQARLEEHAKRADRIEARVDDLAS